MKLENIEVGMFVVGNEEEYYEGLGGYIAEIRKDKKSFETENDTEYEIVVNFIETGDMGVTHPGLNGTGVSQVIMGEDELIFFPEGLKGDGIDSKGDVFPLAKALSTYKGYKEKIV